MGKNVIFKRKVGGFGPSSFVINIPKEIAASFDIEKGDYLDCYVDEGKHGQYFAFWKPKEDLWTKNDKEIEYVEIEELEIKDGKTEWDNNRGRYRRS